MIYVTHDQVEAMTMADKIVVLNEGRIEQVGPPMELYHRPRTEFVAGFIGAPSMNFLDVVGGEAGLAYGAATLPAPPADATGPLRLGVRPEHIRLAAPGAGNFDAEVLVKEALGGESYLHIRTGKGDALVVRTDGDDPTRSGDAVGLVLPPERLHLFGPDGANRALAARA
jgi:ABC-type sugar transport system ATPase subunit